jgi:hypothetical protein
MTDLPPMAKWMAAVIAGGGTASFTQGVTAILRAKSTVFTGGFGNPVIATGELGGSVLLSLLALGGAARRVRGGHLDIVARTSSDPATASGNAGVNN